MTAEIRHVDRRCCRRSRETHLLTVTPRGSAVVGKPVYSGRTLDVTERGVQIETREPLALGQELKLEIAFAGRILCAEGKAVHTELLADGLCGAGIVFTGAGLRG